MKTPTNTLAGLRQMIAKARPGKGGAKFIEALDTRVLEWLLDDAEFGAKAEPIVIDASTGRDLFESNIPSRWRAKLDDLQKRALDVLATAEERPPCG